MQRVQHRRQEHEGEFHGLGDAGEKRGQAQREQQTGDTRAPLLPCRVVHRQTSPRQTKHHDGEETGHEGAGGGIAREKSFQIAGGPVVVADDEPCKIVENMVQPGDDQDAIQDAIGEQADGPGTQDGVAGRVQAALERRPRVTDDRCQREAGEAADDGHEAPSAEKTQVAWQCHVAEAVVGDAGDDSGEKSDRDAELREFARAKRRERQIASGSFEPDEHVCRDGHDRFNRPGRYEKADERGETGGAMVLARKTDTDAHRKQQSEIRENRIAGSGHRCPPQYIGLPKPQQQPCDRQYGNRQHQRAAQLLQPRESCIHGASPEVMDACATSERTSAAVASSRQRLASARQSAMRTARIWRLIAGIAAGTTDSSRIPKPSRTGTAIRSAATPPHTATVLPASMPAFAVSAINLSTAECSASVRPASAAWPRSIASVYCVRSLLPIDRKSTSRSKTEALSAAAGVSIMAPSLIRGPLPSSALSSSMTVRTVMISVTSVTIGMSSCTTPKGSTRKAARSCVRSRSGRASAVRTPRRPSAGFSSCGRGRYFSGLSPPTSMSLRTSGLAPRAVDMA